MWLQAALEMLRGCKEHGAWGYKPRASSWTEPTALATLALAAHGEHHVDAGRWLAEQQLASGEVVIGAGWSKGPGWPTPLAVFAWSALGGFDGERERALSWLLEEKGKTEAPSQRMGHDPTIVGWPWVEATHSWIEPTALAVAALRRSGRAEHARTKEGLRLLRDRALPSEGGWNYGNTIVYGHELRPQPAPTGQALIALAKTEPSEITGRACAYLEKTLPTVRAPMSLGWGLLGLRAWARAPAEAGTWLAESFERARARTDDLVPHLALLLLAESERTLELLT